MERLQVRCPRCKDELELDPGFAGGVCRCSSCGALMTVPGEEPGSGRRFKRKRSDRPDVPTGGPLPPEAEDTKGGTSLFGFTLSRPKREASVDEGGSIDELEAKANGQLQVLSSGWGMKWYWVLGGVLVLAVVGGVGYFLGWYGV